MYYYIIAIIRLINYYRISELYDIMIDYDIIHHSYRLGAHNNNIILNMII